VKQGIRCWAYSLLLFASSAGAAVDEAQIPFPWSFSDVAFSDGGSVSGHFDYSPDAGGIMNWSIWVTGGDRATFPVFEYRPDNSTAQGYGNGEIVLVVPATQRQFHFRSATPLDDTQSSVALDVSSPTSSFESYGGDNPKRVIQAGALVVNWGTARVRWFFDLTFVDGGTVSGYADHSSDDTLALAWDVTVTGGDEAIFAPLTYLPANSTPYSAGLDHGRYLHSIVLKNTRSKSPRELRYTGQAPMGAYGGRIALDTVNSVECFDCLTFRRFSGGTLRGVPDETWGNGFE